jgi:hypothetical protein
MALKKWTCSKCKIVVEAIASEVTHRCPSNQSKVTAFEPETSKK